MSHKQILYSLLAENKIAQVITELRSNTAGVIELHEEVLQLSARFQQNEKKRRLDIENNEDVNREYNKIRNALLSVIERLPNSSIASSVKKNKWVSMSVWLLVAIVSIIFVAKISETNLTSFSKKEEIKSTPQQPIEDKAEDIKNVATPVEKKIKNPEPLQKPKPNIEKPIQESPKYISVSLIVDLDFSKADIFANGKAIYPLSDDLLIKKLQIEYTSSTIELILKTLNTTRRKNITIPNDYFNNPTTIEVICTQ